VTYAPLRRWAHDNGTDIGAYDETGPVFIHPDPCAGPDGIDFPAELRDDPRVLRSYNHDGSIRDGVVVDGGGAFDDIIAELLADPDVAFLHARAVGFGCYTFAITRTLARAT
jgi:hypothetical protein